MTTNLGTTTTYFVGSHYEVVNGVVTKYYYAGAQRIAMRQNGILSYLLGDHLGSTSLVTDATGHNPIETRYKAWGEVRYASGTSSTNYTYTGQYSDSYINLLDYGSRRYDPELGRFIQPDSIVPTSTQGVQAYDRYAYVSNNPIRYNDPTGHMVDPGQGGGCSSCKFPKHNYYTWWAQLWAKKSGGYMSTYAVAGIGVQNPVMPRPDLGQFIVGEYTGLGIAKVTDKEMNTPYGDKIYDGEGNFRGNGLGMMGEDQTINKTAVKAMMTRNKIRTEICESNGCSSTDIFIAAALAENGPGFPKSSMKDLVNGVYGKQEIDPANPNGATLPWQDFLNSAVDPDEKRYNRFLIGQFASNVLYLQDKGWDVPDVDWEYVYSLTVTTEQP